MSRQTGTPGGGTDATESTAGRRLVRREFVATVAGVAGLSALAGCSGGSNDDGSDDVPLDDSDGTDAAGETDGTGSTDAGDSSDGTGDTGDESTEQVSANLNVLGSVGNVGSDGESIDEIRLVVGLAAGSNPLDLADVTIQYVDADSFANLVHSTAAGDAEAAFATSVITAEDGSNDVLTERSDRYEIVVPLGRAVPDGGDNGEVTPLASGESAELTITAGNGSQLVATVQAPDSLAGETSGDTVTL